MSVEYTEAQSVHHSIAKRMMLGRQRAVIKMSLPIAARTPFRFSTMQYRRNNHRGSMLNTRARNFRPASNSIVSNTWRKVENDPIKALYGLMGINVGVFCAWKYVSYNHSRKGSIFMHRHFTLSNYGVQKNFCLHTLITSAFSHVSFGHLAVNMFALYMFGREVVHSLGPKRFLKVYFAGATLSSVCQLSWNQYSASRSHPRIAARLLSQPCLGASGAVNTITALNILQNPHSMIYIYGILPVPAFICGSLFMAKDLFGLQEANNGVGNAAHLGGSVFGGLVFLYFRNPAFRSLLRR